MFDCADKEIVNDTLWCINASLAPRKTGNIGTASRLSFCVACLFICIRAWQKRQAFFCDGRSNCVYFELIWDDAEALKQAAQLSHPKPTINTSDLGPEAVRLANGLSQNIDRLSDDDCKALYEVLLARL